MPPPMGPGAPYPCPPTPYPCTGPQLVSGSPCHDSSTSKVLSGCPPPDACQQTTDPSHAIPLHGASAGVRFALSRQQHQQSFVWVSPARCMPADYGPLPCHTPARGLSWCQVCPVTTAAQAKFCLDVPRQMHASRLWPSHTTDATHAITLHRVGQGLSWWRISPATAAIRARLCQVVPLPDACQRTTD